MVDGGSTWNFSFTIVSSYSLVLVKCAPGFALVRSRGQLQAGGCKGCVILSIRDLAPRLDLSLMCPRYGLRAGQRFAI